MSRRRFLKFGALFLGLIWARPLHLLTHLGGSTSWPHPPFPLGGDPIHRADWPYAPEGLDPFEALRFRLIHHGLPERERAKQMAAEGGASWQTL